MMLKSQAYGVSYSGVARMVMGFYLFYIYLLAMIWTHRHECLTRQGHDNFSKSRHKDTA